MALCYLETKFRYLTNTSITMKVKIFYNLPKAQGGIQVYHIICNICMHRVRNEILITTSYANHLVSWFALYSKLLYKNGLKINFNCLLMTSINHKLSFFKYMFYKIFVSILNTPLKPQQTVYFMFFCCHFYPYPSANFIFLPECRRKFSWLIKLLYNKSQRSRKSFRITRDFE